MSNPLKKSEKWKSPLTSMHRTPIIKWREGKQQNARQAFSEQRRHLKMKQYCVWLEKKLTHCLWWWQKYEMKAQRSREITVVCEAQWGKRRNIKGEEWWRANVSEIYRSTKLKVKVKTLKDILSLCCDTLTGQLAFSVTRSGPSGLLLFYLT